MNKEQEELVDEVYENYLQHYDDEYNEEQKKIQKNPLHWMENLYQRHKSILKGNIFVETYKR